MRDGIGKGTGFQSKIPQSRYISFMQKKKSFYLYDFITECIFCWSFIKSQEINQFEKSTLYHSLGIKMPPMISSSFFLLKLHEKSKDRRDMKTQKVWCQNFWLLSLWYEIWPFILLQEFMKFEDMKTQKYGVKTFYCSHCDKKFSLLFCDRNFMKFAAMKTQKIWCQNFLLLSLW